MTHCKKLTALFLALSLVLLCGCHSAPAETQPTTLPTEVTAPPTTLPPETTLPTEPEPELHSGLREDGTFDGGTLFIGDSLTYGLIYTYLMSNDLLGDARYMAVVGAPVLEFFKGTPLTYDRYAIFSKEFENKYYYEAVESVGEEITAIYFMMGTNFSSETTASTYIEIVDFMLEKCPNATVYLQMVPYSTSGNVEYDLVNWVIMEAYGHYAAQGTANVKLLDIKRAVGVNLTADGVHLTYKGQENWYNALVAHAEENNIPQ